MLSLNTMVDGVQNRFKQLEWTISRLTEHVEQQNSLLHEKIAQTTAETLREIDNQFKNLPAMLHEIVATKLSFSSSDKPTPIPEGSGTTQDRPPILPTPPPRYTNRPPPASSNQPRAPPLHHKPLANHVTPNWRSRFSLVTMPLPGYSKRRSFLHITKHPLVRSSTLHPST